ncbi:MAG: MBL fold metallo-hydrolase, partial [Promethearchaeota archaeon]
SRFPSGNALVIMDKKHLFLIDTNPGFNLLKEGFSIIKEHQDPKLKKADIRSLDGIFLTHPHLDHSRALFDVFSRNKAKIYSHSDTLMRIDNVQKIGLLAGISRREIHYFQEFGKSLGFKNENYDPSRLVSMKHGQEFKFGEISIKAFEFSGHTPHLLVFQIEDLENNLKLIFSADYDFTPISWYGIPLRGYSIKLFLDDLQNILNLNAELFISSHLRNIIEKKNAIEQITKYQEIFEERTKRAIELTPKLNELSLEEYPEFVYPISKMKGRFSEAYIELAKIWDRWILLSHLEYAMVLDAIKCTNPAGDPLLKKYIRERKLISENEARKIENTWCDKSLKLEDIWRIPLESRWTRIE